MRKIRKHYPTESRIWYNEWAKGNAKGEVLDIGKRAYWDYGFSTIDADSKLNPAYTGNICKCDLPGESYDVTLCNGMYEFVDDP